MVAATLVACNSDQAATVRQFTYARDFRYYEAREIQGVMAAMARIIRRLDEILKRDEPTEDARQVEVVQLLESLEQTAGQLRSGATSSNHPRLTENVGAFLADVQHAREAAQRTPPNYFLAGNITGACLHCHAPGP